MTYYDVAFCYPVQEAEPDPPGFDYDNDFSNASKLLVKYEKLVEDTLAQAGVKFKHSYCWPDGSLYKFIETELEEKDLYTALSKLFENTRVYISAKMFKKEPSDDPHKCGYSTLHNYMQGIMDSTPEVMCEK